VAIPFAKLVPALRESLGPGWDEVSVPARGGWLGSGQRWEVCQRTDGPTDESKFVVAPAMNGSSPWMTDVVLTETRPVSWVTSLRLWMENLRFARP
jgi:hypothetical protein